MGLRLPARLANACVNIDDFLNGVSERMDPDRQHREEKPASQIYAYRSEIVRLTDTTINSFLLRSFFPPRTRTFIHMQLFRREIRRAQEILLASSSSPEKSQSMLDGREAGKKTTSPWTTWPSKRRSRWPFAYVSAGRTSTV